MGMKRFNSCLLALILTLLSTNSAFAVNFRQEDKQKHLAATTGISSVTYLVSRQNNLTKTQSFFLAVGTAFAVGMAKEATDPFVDHDDLVANLAGSGLGALMSFSIDFSI
jgi:hypothetical protein